MFYTYLTQGEGNFGFGVCSELLCKKLPHSLCYFEVFGDKKEAKHREEYFKKLSYARLSSLIKSKRGVGFTCHNEGEKTIICLKNGRGLNFSVFASIYFAFNKSNVDKK